MPRAIDLRFFDDDRARRRRRAIRLAGLATAALAVLAASLTVVDATQYALVLRFGRVVRVIKTPGLAFVCPLDRVRALDKRLLLYSPPPSEFLTLDKKNIVIEPLLAWRIVAPAKFLTTVGDRASAEVRLADIAFAEIGSVLGRYPFAALVSANGQANSAHAPIDEIRRNVAAAADAAYGIELAHLGLRQLSLPRQNRQSVFERMTAERGRLAKRYRSEGELEAKRIIAEADREKVRIDAEAYAEAQRIRADGDAQAARIYAAVYSRDPAFYRFARTLEAYGSILDANTTVVLPGSAEALAILHGEAHGAARPPTPPPPKAPNAVIGILPPEPSTAFPGALPALPGPRQDAR